MDIRGTIFPSVKDSNFASTVPSIKIFWGFDLRGSQLSAISFQPDQR
jgi:hypothetical protein